MTDAELREAKLEGFSPAEREALDKVAETRDAYNVAHAEYERVCAKRWVRRSRQKAAILGVDDAWNRFQDAIAYQEHCTRMAELGVPGYERPESRGLFG